MILNIRGTSGAGKTYIVKNILARSLKVEPWWPKDTPTGLLGAPAIPPYGHQFASPIGAAVALGGYDGVQCGGCDQLMKGPWYYSRDKVYEAIQSLAPDRHVLYEGLLISEVKRCAALKDAGLDVKVILIDEPVEKCLDAVNDRRRARGVTTAVNPKLTVEKHRELRNQARRLQEAGVEVHTVMRDEAMRLALELFGWQK